MQASDLLLEHLPVATRRLRVAMVTETYPPEINGVAMTIGRIVDALQARNHQVQLIRPRQPGDSHEQGRDGGLEQVLRPGIPIPHYNGLNVGLPAKGLLTRLWTLRRPDVIQIATEGPLGWSALASARKLGIPVLAGFHTNFHTYSRHYGLGWLKKPIHAYLRKFHNQANVTLVPSQDLRIDLTRQGYRNIEVLARGVDGTLFSPERRSQELRQQWGIKDNELAVIYVGRLAPEKNIALLIRTFEAIKHIHPDAKLILVGDGPEANMLKAAHPGFIHAGPRTGTDLAAHYASADMFLFPSLTETFGNVLLEAMASGLAVLGFDYAAAAEHVLHGENGLKAAFGDEAAFIEQARLAATQPVTRARIGAAARETALTVSWERIFNRLEGLYMQLVSDAEIRQEAAIRRLIS